MVGLKGKGMKRSSGILLPVFSLPSAYGIGTFGREAYNFIDFLSDAGQKYWQVLPLGPTGFGDSPYQCFSTYAGNPLFIDLDMLVADGLLDGEKLKEIDWGHDPTKVDYVTLYIEKVPLLRKAFTAYDTKVQEGSLDDGPFREFCQVHSEWLENYAFFIALKEHFEMKSWLEWNDEGIRLRLPEAMERYKELLSEEIRYHAFVQYLFFTQWQALRTYGREKGIGVIGDLPIYISMDSADAWSGSCCLKLDENGFPAEVGGVPPDGFSETGQLWGNPLYHWETMKEDGYSWWMNRIGESAKLFDIIRLDHFRGLQSYWSIPYGAETAVNGKWMQGPGMDFINRVKECFPGLLFIAEDLGFLTEEVHRMVEASGFPGMKVLQFAFGSGNCCNYLPHMYESNTVVYTGTHDNTTARGWLEEESTEGERSYAVRYFGLSAEEGLNWGFIRGAMSSVANLCIVQMQDYLNLPGTARINRPGTLGGNWQWRLEKGQLRSALAERIANIAGFYNR
ncbi:MAG: 4-alpha-glucanotransferase [Anaerovoracaceae bacterium]